MSLTKAVIITAIPALLVLMAAGPSSVDGAWASNCVVCNNATGTGNLLCNSNMTSPMTNATIALLTQNCLTLLPGSTGCGTYTDSSSVKHRVCAGYTADPIFTPAVIAANQTGTGQWYCSTYDNCNTHPYPKTSGDRRLLPIGVTVFMSALGLICGSIF